MKRVLLLDPAGAMETVSDVLAGHGEVRVERAVAVPPDVVAVLVSPEVPVGRAALEGLPGVGIVAATATGPGERGLTGGGR